MAGGGIVAEVLDRTEVVRSTLMMDHVMGIGHAVVSGFAMAVNFTTAWPAVPGR